jgi:site-specific recombinase XerC
VLHVRQGKGFRERDVPLPQAAREPLKVWLKEREKMALRTMRCSWSCVPALSRCSMQSMIVEVGQRAGLDQLDPP